MPDRERNRIFVSYSHEDRRRFDEFMTMMDPVISQDLIDIWSDTRIRPGQRWMQEIEQALTSARVGVLLVSKSFLASDFIKKYELPRLLEAAEADGAIIFWVLLSPCFYESTGIAKYQAAHNVSCPLGKLWGTRRDAAWLAICVKLRDLMRHEHTQVSASFGTIPAAHPETAPAHDTSADQTRRSQTHDGDRASPEASSRSQAACDVTGQPTISHKWGFLLASLLCVVVPISFRLEPIASAAVLAGFSAACFTVVVVLDLRRRMGPGAVK
jgi:hypothetical protein